MERNYTRFNLVCLVLSGLFLVGIAWTYVRNSKNYEIIPPQRDLVFSSGTNYESQTTNSSEQIADNNITKQQYNNVTIQQFNNEKASSTVEQSMPVQSLPKEFLLSVPFTSQAPEKNWEEPWQDGCEEAALLMLDAYYKNYNLSPLFAKDELLKMIKWEEEKGFGNSIEMEKVKQVAEEYFGLAKHLSFPPLVGEGRVGLKIIENPTVEQIKKSIAAGNPVLVVADGKVLPNPHYRNGGPVYHALIIKGYTKTEFITNDPGTQFGKDFKYKYADLLNAIHDWNNGDVKNGRKAVLVVE